MEYTIGYTIFVKIIPIALICSVILIFLVKRIKKTYQREKPENFLNPAELLQENRRRPDRAEVNLDVILDTSGGKITAVIENMSPAGAFIQCSTSVPLKETFTIILGPKDQHPLLINAQITWSNSPIAGDHIINRGMGVRFVNNPQEIRQAIKAIVKQHNDDVE